MATKKQKVTAAPIVVKPKMLDIMLDLETLDTQCTAAIMSIGACRFDVDEIDNEGFYRVVTMQSNMDEHRSISPDTLTWWLGQTDKAKAIFTDPSAVTLGTALDDLRDWIGPEWKNVRIWSNGADFDIPMLKHAYGLQQTPWLFYNTRCFRTAKSEPAGKRVPAPPNLGAHNALFDAIAQAQHLQAIWKANGR